MSIIKLLPIAFLSIFFLMAPQKAFSITNEKLIESAKQIVSQWSRLLKEDHTLVDGEYGIWCVYRSVLVSDLSFDIQETSSIISPYLLIITGKTRWDNNLDSVYADRYSEVFSKNQGFKTKEKALLHVNEDDFGRGSKREYNIRIYYAFQGGSWVLKEPNADFLAFLNEEPSKVIKKGMADLITFKIE